MTTPRHVSGTIQAVADALEQWANNLQDGREVRPSVMGLRDMAKVIHLAAIQPDPEPVAWQEGFFALPAGSGARLRECATEGCYQHCSIRVEIFGVGSDHCEPCARKIAGHSPTPTSAGTVSVEAAARVLLEDNDAVTHLAIETMRNNRAVDGRRPGYAPAIRAALRALAGERG